MSYTFKIDYDAVKKIAEMPFFEDANSGTSSYHASRMTVEKAQLNLQIAIARLGGAVLNYVPVIFESPHRYGYLVEYAIRGGAFGRMPIAGLPLKTETEKKIEQVRVQALLIARDIFEVTANGPCPIK